MKDMVKKVLPHFLAILLFVILAVTYYAPAVFDGKVLQQDDSRQFEGMAKELLDYHNDKTDEDIIAWQGNMFSGMPSYHTTVVNAPTNYLSYVGRALSFLNYNHVRILFISLVCFYILMCVLGVNIWLAIAGSIAFAFASYNIIIIQAGHITKAYVIAYMPIVLAAMALLFKKRYVWGAVLFVFGVAISVLENHLQITYYLMILCLFVFLGFAWFLLKNKQVKKLLKMSGIMLVCVILAVLANYKNMYSNVEMSKTSTRGATELTSTTTEGAKTSSGLDKEYAFQWSYGKKELLTLLIPNAYGGPSVSSMGPDSELYKEMRAKGIQVGKEVQTYTYWGDKTTQGPVYFGALICFLFVFAMFLIRNPMKWWLFAAALFFTLLALGRYFDSFNTFFFNYLPLYNKFRTVEMALVIPGMVLPIVAIWGLKELFSREFDEKLFKKGLITALAITGGLCLIIWLIPDLLLSFRSPLDERYQLPDWYYNALLADRKAMASSDAFRSLLFILAGAALLFWYARSKSRTSHKTVTILSACIAVLVLADLWAVDKRYLNESHFSRQKLHESYQPSVADNEIMKDKDHPNFRVLNLNNNTFQEANTSYFHHAIGGYHAAKLRRYQELIEHRLIKELTLITQTFQSATSEQDIARSLINCPSLNMLNTRYLIYDPEQPPIRNPFAYGNAWFVQEVQTVEKADDEIGALNTISPLKTAVVDRRFENDIKDFRPTADSTATIVLDSYRPNRLIYTSHTATEQIAVFSEIYYQPGWKAYIDGKPAPHFRADWTLRGMVIPAGKHEIKFEFYPDGYVKAAYLESFSSLAILLLLIAAIGYSVFQYVKKGQISFTNESNEAAK